jgi:membrane protein insertase Oxa1/YidC/SpoIIIJ
MPAALTLYMTVNQLLSVLQAYLTKKFDDKKVAA